MDATYASPTFVFAALVIFVAIFVRTLTGFGAALVLVPLLSLAWDLRQVVLIAALVQATTGFPVAISARKAASRQALITLLIGSLCGLAVGAFLLAVLPLPYLRRFLGVLTLLFGLSRFTLTGAIGTGGPPIVAYLQFRLNTTAARRATLLLYFMVLDLARLPGYLRLGIGSATLIWTGLALIPFALLGAAGGNWALGRLSDTFVSQAIALLLVLTGVLLIR